MELIGLRSPVAGANADGLVAMVPIGSVEQHSDHLPLGTDAIAATAVATAVERDRPAEVLLCPTVWYGASDHHLGYPGTVTVGTEALVDVLVGVCVSLRASSGVKNVLVVNGHGGNRTAMALTAERVARNRAAPRMWGLCYWDAMNAELARTGEDPVTVRHACAVETSILLALDHPGVDMSAADPDTADPDFPEWLVTSSGFPARTTHGGVGDPTSASASEGSRYLRAAAAGVVDLVDRIGHDWADIPDR
ncbi:MAG: creatininase family protein [Mycobacteriales bacterium]